MIRSILFVFAFGLGCFTCIAQGVFSFPKVYTALQVSVEQSPAHWYLRIKNNTPEEHTLRWKFTRGFSCPPEWHFSFDDQNQYYPELKSGDSSNFTLLVKTEILQKLIIGNTLNNTPGRGSVFFDVYEPSKKEEAVRIEYEFIVSSATNISGVINTELFYIKEHTLYCNSSLWGSFVSVFALNGQRILAKKITEEGIKIDYNKPIVIQLYTANKVQFIKIFP